MEAGASSLLRQTGGVKAGGAISRMYQTNEGPLNGDEKKHYLIGQDHPQTTKFQAAALGHLHEARALMAGSWVLSLLGIDV